MGWFNWLTVGIVGVFMVYMSILFYWDWRMNNDFRKGQTVWIRHDDSGDVLYKIKFVLERQPKETELCKHCAKGHLSLMGHLIQQGILDDKHFAVCYCEHCCSVTVFIYHVEASTSVLPPQADCAERDGYASNL